MKSRFGPGAFQGLWRRCLTFEHLQGETCCPAGDKEATSSGVTNLLPVTCVELLGGLYHGAVNPAHGMSIRDDLYHLTTDQVQELSSAS